MEAAGRLHGCLVALEWLRLDGPVAAALGLTAEQTSEQRGIGPRAVLYEAFERPATRPGEGPSLAEGGPPVPPGGGEARRLRGDAPVPRERPADPDGVEAFLELERSGWKGRAAPRSPVGPATAPSSARWPTGSGGRAGCAWSRWSRGAAGGDDPDPGGGSVEFGFKSAYDEG